MGNSKKHLTAWSVVTILLINFFVINAQSTFKNVSIKTLPPSLSTYRSMDIEPNLQSNPNRKKHLMFLKKAIVVGASSGMGRQVAKLIANDGYEVGLVARRLPFLKSLQKEIPTKTYIKQIDVSEHETAMTLISELIEEMGGLDLIVITVSSFMDIMDDSEEALDLNWKSNKKTIDVDLAGFLAIATVAIAIFEKQKSGHLVGFSSIDGLRGNPLCPVYCGAKAFISTYMEGIRNKMLRNKIPVTVTEIIPGWVDNEKYKPSESPDTYWVESTKKAAQEIYNAIKSKKKKAYISARWRLIAWSLALAPDWLYNQDWFKWK